MQQIKPPPSLSHKIWQNFVTTTSTPSSFPLSQVCVDDGMDEMFVRLDDDSSEFRGSFIRPPSGEASLFFNYM
jgi:hypothetical protein